MRPATALLPARNYTASEESGHRYAGAGPGGEKLRSDEMNVAKRSRPVVRGASRDPVKVQVEGSALPTDPRADLPWHAKLLRHKI
jgi:hypothetical protein